MTEIKELPQVEYQLTEKDFRGTKPKKFATSYSLGEKVTRDNFTAFIIDSFSKSRGRPAAQIAIFQWTQAHTGFNWLKSIDNFFVADGTECLSQNEKQLITNSYFQVKRHEDSDVRVIYKIGQQLDELSQSDYWSDLQEAFPGGFEGLSKSEFLAKLDLLIKSEKEKADKTPTIEPEFEFKG